MMKKLLTAMLMLSIAFTPVGSFVSDGTDNVASAKSYKSGKRSFNTNPSSPAQNNKAESNSFTRKSNNTNSTFNRTGGGLMRGILYGGIAGMLLGGLLGNLGAFGGFIGLLINVLAVVVIISLARRIFRMLKNKRREQDDNPWKR
ncbi:hypothetical protein [Bacillus sp. CECT 9360]|uniref:hypothetical protein n=1 Tax=Bacillus sp. CECT 9360 TaxID=2845821 RepID=UPI001E6503BE|nr:hypothetical protein [Bacillus sp. CECT 9360]CAH0345758.1 hypothetical protein BCI9360_02056 [Bacillus sp. CECT 9360]